MANFRIIFFVILLALSYKIIQGNSIRSTQQDIPKQCVENSVTPVSCKYVTSTDSLLPHPDDCELFYYCVTPDHDPICRQCPANLHFNPVKHVCDSPERAGCVLSATEVVPPTALPVDIVPTLP